MILDLLQRFIASKKEPDEEKETARTPEPPQVIWDPWGFPVERDGQAPMNPYGEYFGWPVPTREPAKQQSQQNSKKAKKSPLKELHSALQKRFLGKEKIIPHRPLPPQYPMRPQPPVYLRTLRPPFGQMDPRAQRPPRGPQRPWL